MHSMRKMMRTLLISLVTAVSLGFAANASAKTFKIATLSPEGSYWMTTMKAAAKEIAKQTEDRVKFRFYPGGVMGNDQAVLKKIRIGQLQGAAFSAGALATRAPDTQVYNIPLLFQSYEQVDYVRKHMDADLEAAFREAGFVNFGFAEGGFAYIMSKQAVAAADDLKKNKVWVPSDDAASQSAVDSFGIAPVTLSLGDVLTGLQTDLIDTVAISPIGAIALHWHTQVSHVLDLPILYIYALLAIEQKSFSKLSEADQQVVDTIMRSAFEKMDKQNRKDNRDAFAALENQGLEITAPNTEQLKVWRARGKKAAVQFSERGKISAPALEKLERLMSEFHGNL